MSKPNTPVRRSKARPGSGGAEIPLTASMEVLPPDPCSSPLLAASDVTRSLDLHGAPMNGSRPPGRSSIQRTRSNEGRRASSGPHEVIPLVSTTSKSFSANHMAAHPLAYPPPSPGPPPLPPSLSASATTLPIPHSPSHASAPFSPLAASTSSHQAQAHASAVHGSEPGPARPMSALSATSSRFNPMTEGEDSPRAAAAGEQQQQQQRGGSAGAGPRTGSGLGSWGGRGRYADPSVSASASQALGYAGGSASGEAEAEAEDSGALGRQSEAPGTPASVVSGRGGGTFFTDLRRSFGAGRPPPGVAESQELGEGFEALYGPGGAPTPGAGPGRGLPSMTSSRHNPMQSPSASASSSERGDDDGDDAAFAEYAGDEAGPGPRPGLAALAGPTPGEGSMALTDYTNPLLTPEDSRAATPPPPPAPPAPASSASSLAASRASLLLVIRDLYVTEPPPPPSAEPSRPATAAGAEEPGPSEPEEGAEEEAGGEEGALAASRAAVAALASASERSQAARRSELGEYMEALQNLKDDSGARLVELPADWGVQLERLFRQRRAEYATLEGWMGPRRFEDLPINQLRASEAAAADPRVEEGLARIRELDSVLNDKLITALISHREAFPEQWAEAERRRLDKHQKAVEEALKKERQKRLRAARIARAVTSLDGPASLTGSLDVEASREGGLGGPGLEQQPSAYSRFFTLNPEEEELVEAVLRRPDDEAGLNPFDLDSAYGAAWPEGGPGERGTGRGPAGLALDDIDIELEQCLPSACPTPSAHAAALARPLSGAAPGGQAGGEGGDGPSRPGSAASSAARSRPGTSGGPGAGGGGGGGRPMSALAAAALHGHPVLMAAAAAAAGGEGGAAGGGLLPARVYEDPRAAARALRAINARLAAFEADHVWDEAGQLADFKPVMEAAKAPGGPGAGVGAGPAKGPALPPPPGTSGGRPASPSRSVRSGAGGPAPSVGASASASVTEAGQRDYLREERLAKELASREKDVDSALRGLKVGEVVRLGEATLKALVEQCRRLQELNDSRRKAEDDEAAARKQRLQQQQELQEQQQQQAARQARAAAASGRGAAGAAVRASRSGGTAAASKPAPAGRGQSASADGGTSPSGARTSSAPEGSPAAPPPQRHNSAGSAGAGGRLAAAGGGAVAGAGARRASDPATSAAQPSTAPSSSAGGAGADVPKQGGTPSKPPGSSSSQAPPPAAASSSAAANGAPVGTPPKPKPAPKKPPSPAPTAAPPPPAAPKPASVADLLDCGLPPPPPPPPP